MRPAKSRPCQRWSRTVQAAQNRRHTWVRCTVTGSPVEPEVLVWPMGWWPLGTWRAKKSAPASCSWRLLSTGRLARRSIRPRSAALRPALRRLELGTAAPLRPLETGHQRGELGRVADEQRRPDDALDVARAAGRNAH